MNTSTPDIFVYHIVIGVLFALAFIAIHTAYSAYEEFEGFIPSAVSDDFERTKICIRDSSSDDHDFIIDQFEERWKNYLTTTELNYYIGRLVEKQFEVMG